MKHKSCRALYDYWDQLRDGDTAPLRSAVEPSAISDHLRDTFILEADRPSFPFRLAGTRLCAVLGAELRSASFLELWEAESRLEVRGVLSGVAEDGVGAVIGVTAQGRSDHDISLELLLLPLIQAGPNFDRILGALIPMHVPYWLGLEPLGKLKAVTSRQLSVRSPKPFVNVRGGANLDASVVAATQQPAERRGRFVVLEGGKS